MIKHKTRNSYFLFAALVVELLFVGCAPERNSSESLDWVLPMQDPVVFAQNESNASRRLERVFQSDEIGVPDFSSVSTHRSLRDPFLDLQWAFDFMRVFDLFDDLHSRFQNDVLPNTVVAVLDTGIDYDHEDLQGRLWINPKENLFNSIDDDQNGFVDDNIGWNFVQNNNNPLDNSSHGSHVAGIIAANANNAQGIAGIASWVKLMVLKVCDSRGQCLGENIRRAIIYAVKNGAKVINISIGKKDLQEFDAFDQTIEFASKAGVLVVVAAGNGSEDVRDYSPGNNTFSFTVGANDKNRKRGKFSNFGEKIDLYAPGVDIWSLNSKKCGENASQYCSNVMTNLINKNYILRSGTSMASPHVSSIGAIAYSIAEKLKINFSSLHARQAVKSYFSGKNIIEAVQNSIGLKIYFKPRDAFTRRLKLIIDPHDRNLDWKISSDQKGLMLSGNSKDLNKIDFEIDYIVDKKLNENNIDHLRLIATDGENIYTDQVEVSGIKFLKHTSE